MPVVGNRIKVASSSTGTGNITLGSAEDGYQTFASGGISNNDVVRYVITEGSAWEIGKGTYLTSGPTLVRTSGNLLESSTGSLLNLGGSATVFVSLADVDVMQTDGGTFSGDVTFSGNNHSGVTWDTSEDEFLFAEGSRIDFGGGANIRRESDGILRITGATADDTYFNFSNNLIFYRSGSAAAQLMYSSGSQRFHAYGNITAGGTVTADGLTVAGSSTSTFNSGAENVVATFTSTDTEAQINLVDSTGSAQIRSRNDLRFFTNGGSTRAMDIDSSGNLMVGGTDTFPHDNSATSGTAIGASGYLSIARSGGISGYFNRMSSDGDIVQFRKDGSTVGSIGTQSGRLFIADDAQGGISFASGSKIVYPVNSSGGIDDAALALGGASQRFTDLYLSNSLKVITATNGTSIIDLGDTADNDIGRIAYDNSVNEMYFKTNNSEAMRIDNSGDITIGGTVTATDFNTTSDVSLKTNISTFENPLDVVSSLRGVTFDWIDNGKSEIGVIAQEVEKVLPELVSTNKEGIKSVKYGNLVAVLIEAIKDQQSQINELKSKLS